MLGIFRTNQFLINLLLLFYAAALHLSAFILPEAIWEIPARGVLSTLVYQWLPPFSMWADITAILLVFVQAVILNVFFADNRITKEYTLFPGLFYILLSSFFPEFLYLSPLLMANTFYLLAYKELFATYRKPKAAKPIFNAGLWLGLASLFYFPFTFFLIWGFISLNVTRAFRIRERYMLLTGMLVPYILAGSAYFYWESLDAFIQLQFISNFSWLDLKETDGSLFYIKLFALGLLVLVILLSYGSYSSRTTIDVQKKISLLYWGLLFGGLSLLFQSNITLADSAILTIPLGILLSINFTRLSNRWAESWHLLLITALLIFHYHSFFFLSSL